MKLTILFEDQWLLAVDKPSGLPTQGTLDKGRPNLFDCLKADGRWSYVGLHHRLDVQTSGVVLFTTRREANRAVASLFRNREVEKFYLAWLVGTGLGTSSVVVRDYLKPVRLKNGKTIMKSVRSGGDVAETEILPLASLGDRTLVLARPRTGRMHQIRVHCASLGLPICGDSLYGERSTRYTRLMLHAWKIKFQHPMTGEGMVIISPPPAEMEISPDMLKSAD
ncbi:MAG: RluA family pseudouridine synthase [Bdellovibrionaceae bacterium]|nr:RluA family pseudouridine synthase [Pseudobdellovibrionaceae bacterium]